MAKIRCLDYDRKRDVTKAPPGLTLVPTLPMLPALIIKFVLVPSLMWWCVFNRKIMVGTEGADVIKQGHGAEGADVIKQGHGTI